MSPRFKSMADENGSIMVVTLLILVILTLVGITAATTSKIEVQVAGNQKFHKIAFHHADSGIYTTPKLISAAFDTGVELSGPGISYLGNMGDFYREIMGYNPYDSDRDVRITLAGYDVDVDVNRLGTETLAGSGAEFASGAEGIGVGSTGGMAVIYGLDSLGEGPSEAQSNIGAVYRKIVGTPGGL
ncbi:MAG: PilX N-terminal domain-containing pilus assembly protein [Deltaproteobacteria bacterium]|jgi:hypothetical protein